MICKSCGASVKEGQFTCSSCGAYLNKNNTIDANSSEGKGLLSNGSDLYSHKSPVIVNEGWKWYVFMTWCVVLLWSIGNLFSIIDGFKLSAVVGLTYLGIAILGFVTHSKLVNFSISALPCLYALLFSPVYIIIAVFIYIENRFDGQVNLWDVFFKSNSLKFTTFCVIVFAIINIVYFQNRKDEFQY